jgi:hypothetical protein
VLQCCLQGWHHHAPSRNPCICVCAGLVIHWQHPTSCLCLLVAGHSPRSHPPRGRPLPEPVRAATPRTGGMAVSVAGAVWRLLAPQMSPRLAACLSSVPLARC